MSGLRTVIVDPLIAVMAFTWVTLRVPPSWLPVLTTRAGSSLRSVSMRVPTLRFAVDATVN